MAVKEGFMQCTACGRVILTEHANSTGRCGDCAGKTAAELRELYGIGEPAPEPGKRHADQAAMNVEVHRQLERAEAREQAAKE